MKRRAGLQKPFLKTSLLKSRLTASLPRPRALAVVVAPLLAAFASVSCGGGCDERFVVDRASPEGYTVATIYVRDCGLRAEEMTHVNLRPREEKFKPDAGGVIKDGEVFTVAGHQTVYLGWKDERHLEVRCVGCGNDQVFKNEGSWKSVSISYADR